MSTAKRELPVTINTAPLYWEQHSRYDEQAEALRQQILNLPDTLKAADGCDTYYISWRGDDAADGRSPETAWRTVANLGDLARFRAGDAVLFERDGVYRNAAIVTVPGVSYGAYGEGPKPCLYAGDKDYADPALWEKTDTPHLWRVKVPTDPKNRQDKMRNDIGNIVFDYGKILAGTTKRYRLEQVQSDFDFFHDVQEDYLYLYLRWGNPGALYKSIEIVPKLCAFYCRDYRGLTIENICMKYAFYGVSAAGCNDVVIRGCEIGYIGGSLAAYDQVRAGNGIEIYADCDNVLVENCWIYHCFDAGYTNQGPGTQQNITIRGNLMEYSQYNIEVWVSRSEPSKMANSVFEDNILRFAGYSFGSFNRINSSSCACANISACVADTIPSENFTIKNNVLDCSYRYLLRMTMTNDPDGVEPVVTDNVWVQKPFENNDSVACVGHEGNFNDQTLLGCRDLDEMKASVAKIDINPTAVIFEG